MARRPRDHKPLKERARGLFRTQFKCCGRTWHTSRQWNAHHIAYHSGMWMSKKARAAERAMGKQLSNARRHAMGHLRAAGLRDHRGQLTAKARARPELRGRVSVRQLRRADRHDRESDRTDQRAARHERNAARSDARAERAAAFAARLKQTRLKAVAQRADARVPHHRNRAATYRGRVADTRMAHHQRWPERTRT